MSPAQAPEPIDAIERTLRGVIDDVLSDRFGPDWTRDTNAQLGPEWAAKLEEKAREDRKVQAPNVVYEKPLAYAEFRDLGELLKKHKGLFRSIFSDWDTTLAYFWAAEKLRNAIQHNRDIAPAQQALLEGIAGEIRDTVDRWRIGTPLRVKRTVVQFRDFMPVEGKPEPQVLREAAGHVAEWRTRILEALRASSVDPARARETEEEEYKYAIRVGHVEASIWTQPSAAATSEIEGVPHKDFSLEFKYKPAFKYRDAFLEVIDKPYHFFAYELEDKLDIRALRDLSAERAGLDPSGSGSFNGELENLDYSMFGGRLRLGAWKEAERTPASGGRLFAMAEPPDAFWRAHELMGPERLLAFMVGDITPRAMMHLFQTSRRPLA